MSALFPSFRTGDGTALPRVGLAGAGPTGRLRAAALAASGAADVVAIADPDPVARGAALAFAPHARPVPVFDALLDLGLDAIILATPRALRADHAIAGLERGLAVYCLSPLGRTEAETRRVLAAARSSERPFRADRWFHHVRAARVVRDLIRNDALGRIHKIDLAFHATAPAGRDGDGGAEDPLRELGTDLLDLALWAQDFPRVETAEQRTDVHGSSGVARARLRLTGGIAVRLDCSRRPTEGAGATIQATFRGTRADAIVRNVEGSRVQFVAALQEGARQHTLIEGSDDWGRRAMVGWALDVARRAGYAAAEETLLEISAAFDRLAWSARRADPIPAPRRPYDQVRRASAC